MSKKKTKKKREKKVVQTKPFALQVYAPHNGDVAENVRKLAELPIKPVVTREEYKSIKAKNAGGLDLINKLLAYYFPNWEAIPFTAFMIGRKKDGALCLISYKCPQANLRNGHPVRLSLLKKSLPNGMQLAFSVHFFDRIYERANVGQSIHTCPEFDQYYDSFIDTVLNPNIELIQRGDDWWAVVYAEKGNATAKLGYMPLVLDFPTNIAMAKTFLSPCMRGPKGMPNTPEYDLIKEKAPHLLEDIGDIGKYRFSQDVHSFLESEGQPLLSSEKLKGKDLKTFITNC